MTKIRNKLKARNWVAKNNRMKSARHRSARDYQRQPKHRSQEVVC